MSVHQKPQIASLPFPAATADPFPRRFPYQLNPMLGGSCAAVSNAATRGRRHIRVLGRVVVTLTALVAMMAPTWLGAESKRDRATRAYEQAVELRAQFEAHSSEARKPKDFLRVVAAFNTVYLIDPGCPKSPAALAAEATLYEQMGRTFAAIQYFQNAVNRYHALADEYPGSALARDALLAEAAIDRDDLGDHPGAIYAYTQFLKQYPYAPHAAEARQQLQALAGHLGSPPEANGRATASNHPPESVPRPAPPASIPAANPTTAGNSIPAAPRSGGLIEVNDVHFWEGPNYTRIVITMQDEAPYHSTRLSNPDRIVFDIPGTRVSRPLSGKAFPVGNGFLQSIRVAQFKPDVSRVVLDVRQINDFSVFSLPNPYRVIIDVHGPPSATLTARNDALRRTSAGPAGISPQPASKGPAPATNRAAVPANPAAHPAPIFNAPPPVTAEAPARRKTVNLADGAVKESDLTPGAEVAASTPPATTPVGFTGSAPGGHPPGGVGSVATNAPVAGPPLRVRTPEPTSFGSTTLTRALGLKIARIVIDPGHGGHDTGTLGPDGVEEKNVVLDVGLRLKKLIEQRMSADVVMTRSDDTFIPLEERTAIANERSADLFISIHANASRDESARGIEVYYLNFTSDANSLAVAARENATSQESVHELQGLIKKIALSEKIEESSEFARQVDRGLETAVSRNGNSQPDRGLKKAPFVVLIGANMPSILAEISFLTNPRDEHLLSQSNYRQQIAEGLYHGIERYVANFGAVKTAQRADGSAAMHRPGAATHGPAASPAVTPAASDPPQF